MDKDGTKKKPEPKINNFGCATLHFYIGFLYVEVGSGPSYSVQRPDRYNIGNNHSIPTDIKRRQTSNSNNRHVSQSQKCPKLSSNSNDNFLKN